MHYREVFLRDLIGSKLVSLAKRVHGFGIVLRAAGVPLTGAEVFRLGKNEVELPENDVRAFLKAIGDLGGWEDNANYTFVNEFLDTWNKPEVEKKDEFAPSSPSVPQLASFDTTSRATADVGLLERPAVESEEPEVVVAAAPASITTSKAKESSIPTPVAPLAPRTERRSVTNAGQKASVQSPVPEHPDVPGLLLQPDGFYWKKEWGDYK